MIYEFRDTTAGIVDDTALPAEAVCYNGHWIDRDIEGFRTLNVSGRELMKRNVESYSIGNEFGEYYRNAKYPSRTIKVTYQLLCSNAATFRAAYNELNLILSAKEAALLFRDEADKYFIATKAGNGEVPEGCNSVVGTIEFFCADPRKYAITQKTFEASANADGVLQCVVENEGNVPASIDYEFICNSDNGFIGIVSDQGTMQYGHNEEADLQSVDMSEQLMTMEDLLQQSDDANDSVNVLQSNWINNGSLQVVIRNDSPTGKWVGLNAAGSGSAWHGAQRTFTLPADSEGIAGATHCTMYFFKWFQVAKAAECGYQTVAFLDAEGHFICGTKAYKWNPSSNKGNYEFWANGKNLKTLEFDCSAKGNPFIATNGHDRITKEGKVLTFFFYGKYYSFVVPEVEAKAVAKIQIGMSALRAAAPMTRNYIGQVSFKKMHVEKWVDIPNRYSEGDVITIDGASGKYYVNGMIRMGDEVTGTEYFKASPGETLIEFHNSEWADTIGAAAKLREAWL